MSEKPRGRPKGEPTQQVAFRLSLPLLERIDQYAHDLNQEHTGARITRADAARVLLEKGLVAISKPTAAKRSTKKKPPRTPSPMEQLIDDEAKFKSAYDTVGQGRPFVRIHLLRTHLKNWKRERFNRTLQALDAEYALELHGGDPSQMSAKEIQNSYVDDQGAVYLTLSWRAG